MNKIEISPQALADLSDIKSYISEELQNKSAANNTTKRILSRIKSLSEHPFSGTPLSLKIEIDTNYRFLVCNNYLAFYYVEDEAIRISRILYGGSDYLKTLFGESKFNAD